MRAIILLLLLLSGAIHAQDFHILNNTPGQREYRLQGVKQPMANWFFSQHAGTHTLRMCTGKWVPVEMSVGDGATLLVHYDQGADTLQHAEPYEGHPRHALFMIPDAVWQRMRSSTVTAFELLDGESRIRRPVTNPEMEMLRIVLRGVDEGPK